MPVFFIQVAPKCDKWFSITKIDMSKYYFTCFCLLGVCQSMKLAKNRQKMVQNYPKIALIIYITTLQMVWCHSKWQWMVVYSCYLWSYALLHQFRVVRNALALSKRAQNVIYWCLASGAKNAKLGESHSFIYLFAKFNLSVCVSLSVC